MGITWPRAWAPAAVLLAVLAASGALVGAGQESSQEPAQEPSPCQNWYLPLALSNHEGLFAVPSTAVPATPTSPPSNSPQVPTPTASHTTTVTVTATGSVTPASVTPTSVTPTQPGTVPPSATPTRTPSGTRELILEAVQDSYVAVGMEIPMGGVPTLRTGQQQGGRMLSLVQFRLSDVPQRTDIQSASLELWCTGSVHASAGGDGQFEVLRVLAPWDERTVTFGTKPGAGDPKVDWDIARCGAPGTPGFAPGPRSVELTELVRSWHDGRLANNGIEIGARVTTSGFFAFVSKEGSSPGEPGPRLVIRYKVPATTPPVPLPTRGPPP